MASDYAPLGPEHDQGIAALWRAVLKQAVTDAAGRDVAARGIFAAGLAATLLGTLPRRPV